MKKIYNYCKFSIEQFAHNVLIAGESERDKSVLLKMILNTFAARASDIGVLYFTFDKGFETDLEFDCRYRFSSPEFTVPYYCVPKSGHLGVFNLARFLVSVLNLHPELFHVFSIVLRRSIQGGSVSKCLLGIFEGVIEYLTENPFDKDFQDYLIESLQKSIERFRQEPRLKNAVKYRKKPPEWFNRWKAGKKVFIDLSECQYFARIFAFGLMIQLANNLTPHTNEKRPQGLIIVEDGNEIFSDRIFEGSLEMIDDRREDADEMFRTFLHFENTTLGYVFEKWIGFELSYRNVSVVTVSSRFTEMYDCISRYAELIFLFKLGKTDRNNYKYNPDLKDTISNLREHQALVLGSGEPFIIEIS